MGGDDDSAAAGGSPGPETGPTPGLGPGPAPGSSSGSTPGPAPGPAPGATTGPQEQPETEPAGSDADPNASARASVVSAASGEVGTVIAKQAGDTDDQGRHLRVGWDHLLDYFHTSAPGVWSDDVVKYADSPGLPAWCGIFALWALHQAGASVGTWHMGSGIASVSGLQPTRDPKPGDVGYVDQPYQHHFIVQSVEGDTVSSIDGNSGGNGSIQSESHSKSGSTFYTAFAPPSGQ